LNRLVSRARRAISITRIMVCNSGWVGAFLLAVAATREQVDEVHRVLLWKLGWNKRQVARDQGWNVNEQLTIRP
jgi:hypothetical protein